MLDACPDFSTWLRLGVRLVGRVLLRILRVILLECRLFILGRLLRIFCFVSVDRLIVCMLS